MREAGRGRLRLVERPSENWLGHERRGRGEPLVLIHGVGSSRRVWEPVLGRLAQKREVIALDLPGHGSSPMPGNGASFSPGALARRVALFMDGLGLEKAHLAGNSLGGWISLELARLGRASSVTGLSPAGLWRGSAPLYIGAAFLASYVATNALGPFAGYVASDPVLRSLLVGQFFGRPWRLTSRQTVETLEGFFGSPGVPRVLEDGQGRFRGGREIDVPVTVAFGAREAILLPCQSQDRSELPPHTRWIPLPGCGHVPTYDDPRLVADVLLAGSSR